MTATLWTVVIIAVIAVLALALACAGAWGWEKQGAVNEKIVELLNKIIAGPGDLDALRCVNPICKRRNTPGEVLRSKLLDVSREAVNRDHQATICKICQVSACDGPDFTKGICAGYNPTTAEDETEPPHTQGGEIATMPDDLSKKLGLEEHKEVEI